MTSHNTLFPPATSTAAATVTNSTHSFEDWLKAVDEYLINLLGLDSASIEDWLWRDAYEGGSSAEEAAEECLAEIFTPF